MWQLSDFHAGISRRCVIKRQRKTLHRVREGASMIARLCLIFACVTFASGNPAAGKTWRWKSPKPLVTPIGPVKSSRIVGGDEAVPHSWTHQVALFIDNTYFCGGSLISNEWVLTAAHCLDGASFVDVVMGAHNIETNEDTQLTLPSSDFIIHEGWNSFAYTNDIAVIRLPLAVTLNAYIGTIDLPSTDVSEGTIVTATGWGRTSDSSTDTTSTLRQVEVPVISNIDCNAVFPLITGGSLCTDGSGPKGTCGGDAGGPLTEGGKIYGITSFEAAGACEGGNPDVFTRVYHYLDWIAENTGVTPPATL